MVQIGDTVALAAGGACLKYMLRTFATPGLKDHTNCTVITLDRAPHCTWDFSRKDAPLDFCPTFARSSCVAGENCTCFAKGNFSSEPFHDQVDGNAHLIIAFHRWCEAAGTHTHTHPPALLVSVGHGAIPSQIAAYAVGPEGEEIADEYCKTQAMPTRT